MSYETRKAIAERDDKYISLLTKKATVIRVAQEWMTDYNALNAQSDASEKVDTGTLRTDLIASLRGIFGI